MRELHLSEEESTEKFFVLVDSDGVRFQLSREQFEQLEPQAEPAAEPEETPEAETDPAVEPEPTPGPAPEPEPLPAPDPLYATPLSMRPNEIQSRIRAGASTAELAEEMGVAESRVEPYAHPVLLERAQVAEAAKMSHPLREDGPAKLTLFEILASAFAARGHSLHDATWDATREAGDAWVVHLRWSAGLSENEALWSFKRQMGSAPTTEARNAVAADLTDPDFVQPVRSLTAVEDPRRGTSSTGSTSSTGDTGDAADLGDTAEIAGLAAAAEVTEGDFLRHPDEEDAPTKRRRKAVTPHWEDVLLGVRTNPKKPRN